MNPFVADPEWGWWIIAYFFLGGIAAGAYFTATLIDLFGGDDNRELARGGYWIAFPLVMICGALLTIDLNQPQRFYHMLFKSEVVERALAEGWPENGDSWATMLDAVLVKYWSPMSVGSWALVIFGLCSGLSFLGSLWPAGLLSWLFRRSVFARLIQLVGCGVGFFVASYTGALLTATNQSPWSDSDWVAPLFLTSAASTGMAVLFLLATFRGQVPAASLRRLEKADRFVLLLESVVFVVFLVSLGAVIRPLWGTWQGKTLILGTGVVGLLIPLALHFRFGMERPENPLAAAFFSLIGGLLLRYGILTAPPEMRKLGPAAFPAPGTVAQPSWGISGLSPEDGRAPLDPGADPLNRPDPEDPSAVRPRSKYFP
jgi:formate-dependent nitrite reductase membrane component NrfD